MRNALGAGAPSSSGIGTTQLSRPAIAPREHPPIGANATSPGNDARSRPMAPRAERKPTVTLEEMASPKHVAVLQRAASDFLVDMRDPRGVIHKPDSTYIVNYGSGPVYDQGVITARFPFFADFYELGYLEKHRRGPCRSTCTTSPTRSSR